MDEIQFTLEDRYLTELQAMEYLHVGKGKFAPYRRVARREGRENMYWLHDLVAVQQGLGMDG
ncbi:MAG: hypothetical protein SOI66_05320 [Bifidobacterium sp.]|jgi:hypothetical protein